MSRRPVSSPSWFHAFGNWLLGGSRKKRGIEDGPPEAAAVEFLEERMVLTAVSGAGVEQLAPNTSTTTTNPDGSTTSSTTTSTSTTNADGSVTTVTTTTTTTTQPDGSTSTTTSSTTSTTSPVTTTVDSDDALGMAVQSDGKIILVGYAQVSNSNVNDTYNFDFAVTRLNADGSIDTTFGTNGKKTIAFDQGGVGKNQDVASCVAIQADGKIVIGGYTQRDEAGNFDFAVVRLNSDGSLDTTFSNDGKATIGFDYGGGGDDRATSMVIQPDGKIVLVGYAQANRGGSNYIAIARLDTDGQLDTSFTGDGRKFVSFNGGDDRGTAVALQSDGRIVIAGFGQSSGNGYDFALVRVTENGTLDRSFSSDGKKMVGFNLGGGKNDIASSVAIQTDGVIVVGGSLQSTLGDTDFGVARVKANGSMDKTFGSGGRKVVNFNLGGNNDDQLTALTLQSDGKIVVGGFTQISLSGDYDFASARLNINGTLDTSFSADGKKTVPFNVGSNDNDLARAIKMQSDGKILIAGGASKSAPVNTDFAITRLNDDGSLDSSFGTNGIKTIPFDLT